ncbi:30S ribosomal protein S8 [Nanoarchaeota archaeon]
MVMNDPLASCLSKIMNAEKIGRRECTIRPASKEIKKVLTILNENGYLGKFKAVDDGKGGFLVLNLLGNINKCGVIKPRFSSKKNEFEKWENRYLPAKDFGLIIVSTPKGYMLHSEAKEKGTGGKLIAYCY